MIKEISLNCPINNLGYGIAGHYIAKELHKKCKVNLFPIGPIELAEESSRDFIVEQYNNAKKPGYYAPCLRIYHQNKLMERIGDGPLFGFPFFELDTFTDEEKYHLNFPDELIVASQWAAGIVQKELKREAFVVPLGVDRKIFYEGSTNKEDNYIFFNAGKWERRKGHHILINCFNRAFEKTDKVKLNLMPHNPFLTQQELNDWMSLVNGGKLKEKINILPRVATHQEVADYMRAADCGVFPSCAEGFNLEALEVLSTGKPLIITNYSAHTEYVNKENAYLIEGKNLCPAYDNKWFFGQGNWLDFDEECEEQLVEHMRYCYKERPMNLAGIETAEKFSWENTANKILELI